MFKSASIPFLRALRPSNPRLNGPFLKGFPLSKNIYFRTTTSFSVSTPKVPSLASLRKIGSPAISNYSEHISAGLKYMNESETKAAYRQFQKAFKLSVDLFGDKSKNAAICLNYLAQASQLEGNLKNSLKFYNEALDIASEGQEANNLLVSDIHHDINLVYQTQGNLVKAKKHVEMSLRILQEYFPEEYKRQSLVLQSLGSIYISSNDLKQAEACLFGSLDILKENQDCESTEFRLLCDKIAALFEKQGNNIEAIKYRKMALSIIDSAQLTQTGLFNQYLNLAALYNKVSKDEESLICLEKAYEQLQYDHQKQNHAHKAPLLIKIGQLCLKLGKAAQAIQRLQEALECLSENGMQSQIMVDKVKKILSQAYSLKNKSSPRIDKLRESLDVMMESSVSYDLNDAEGYKELGLSYLQGLDRENGRKALIRALQIFNGVKGPECAESKELKKILKNAGFF